MYFKDTKKQQGAPEFERKETLLAAPGCPMAFGEQASDGNDFFKNIQDQYSAREDGLVVIKEEIKESIDTVPQDKEEEPKEEIQQSNNFVSLIERPPMSLFESIFNAGSDEDDV